MNRKIKHLKLQTGAFMPQSGTLGDVFPPSNKALNDLTMTSYGNDGVIMTFSYMGRSQELWIPSANVAHAELEPEPTPAPKAVK